MQIRRSGKSRCTEKLLWLLLQRTLTGESGEGRSRVEMWTQVGLGIPPQTRPKEKKKQGTSVSALKIRPECCRPAYSVEFLPTLRETGLGACHQEEKQYSWDRNTQRAHSASSPSLPRALESSHARTREEHQLGWTIPTLHRADTCARQRAVCWSQDKEAGKSFEPLC